MVVVLPDMLPEGAIQSVSLDAAFQIAMPVTLCTMPCAKVPEKGS